MLIMDSIIKHADCLEVIYIIPNGTANPDTVTTKTYGLCSAIMENAMIPNTNDLVIVIAESDHPLTVITIGSYPLHLFHERSCIH
jgi:hypothetical protein